MTCFSGQDLYVELSQKMDELIFELVTSFDKHPTFLPCLHWVTYIKTTVRYSATLWMKVVPCTSHPFFQSSQLFCKPHCLLQRKTCWATLYRHLFCCYCCCFLPLRFNSESFKTANIVNYFWENKAMNSFLCLYFSLQYIFYLLSFLA